MPKRSRDAGYPADLTDEQGAVLAPLLARRAGPGRPPTVSLRAVVNALLYMARAGCPWRLLPREFPHWTAVRYYFDKRTQDGTWAEVNRRLVEHAREQRGRAAQPTAAIIDSQSSKTTEAGEERGFDGGEIYPGAQAALPGGCGGASAGGACGKRGHRRPGGDALAVSRGGPAVDRAREGVGRPSVQRRSGRVAAGGVRDRLGSGGARA